MNLNFALSNDSNVFRCCVPPFNEQPCSTRRGHCVNLDELNCIAKAPNGTCIGKTKTICLGKEVLGLCPTQSKHIRYVLLWKYGKVIKLLKLYFIASLEKCCINMLNLDVALAT